MGYSGMAAAFLAVTSEAKGQIIYTDIDPDAVFNLPASQLDLDGDGVIDFSFYDTSSSAGSSADHGVGVLLPIGNGVIASPAPVQLSPTVLMYGSEMDAGDPGSTNAGVDPLYINLGHHFSSWVYGNCITQTGFIGVHFVAGDGETYYGWIQLDVDIEVHSSVLAYGYESIPNAKIAAGATSASVGFATAQEPMLDAGIAPNPVLDRATITLSDIPANGWSITVMDPLGKVMLSKIAIQAEKSDLDLRSLSPGTYFVRVDDGVSAAFKKVVKR